MHRLARFVAVLALFAGSAACSGSALCGDGDAPPSGTTVPAAAAADRDGTHW